MEENKGKNKKIMYSIIGIAILLIGLVGVMYSLGTTSEWNSLESSSLSN